MRKIASHHLFAAGRLRPRPLVTLDERGRIVDVATWDDLDTLAGVEFHSGLLTTPMVNAHCHLELSAMRGAIPEGGGLVDFARAMSTLPRNTSDRPRAIAAQDATMWSEGIGAVNDICNGDSTFEVKSKSPIAYRNFREIFGLTPNPELRTPNSELRTPHSTYSLQTRPFAEVIAAGEGPLSIHFMESPDEAELFRGRGALHDWYGERGLPPIDFARFGSPVGRLIAQVPPGRDILLIHNTFIGEEEVDLLTDHFGQRLTFVLCPRSNRHITGTLPPVEMLRRKGVRLALGTDSLASNRSLSLLEELKQFPGVPFEERLGWATAWSESALPGLTLIEGFDAASGLLSPAATARRIA